MQTNIFLNLEFPDHPNYGKNEARPRNWTRFKIAQVVKRKKKTGSAFVYNLRWLSNLTDSSRISRSAVTNFTHFGSKKELLDATKIVFFKRSRQ
jgi:hypothetical protein